MKKLHNKVAVITGGNSGIGLATARLFADEGARVVITGRDPQTLNQALAIIGHEAAGIVSDSRSVDQIARLYKRVHALAGKIDVLVINAGVYAGVLLAEFTEEQFDEMNATNFKGAFFAVQKALPYLGYGASLIFTSSALTEMGMSTTAAYAATKAAVHVLARSFSNELAPMGIRVNVVSPGPVDTPIIGRGVSVTADRLAAMKAGRASRTLVGRLAEAGEIAEAILYMASDEARFVTGSELLIDGGMRLKK